MKQFLASILFKPLSPIEYIFSAIVGAVTWLYGDLTVGMGLLIFFTVADFITGLLKAGRNGEIESSKMAPTAYKLAAYIVLIATLHVFFNHYLPTIPGLESGTNLISPTMQTFFNLVPHFMIAILILRELNSNIENLAAGGYIPEAAAKWLGRILSRVGDTIPSNEKKRDDFNTSTGVSDTDGDK